VPARPSRAQAVLIAASLGLFASVLVVFVTSGPIEIGTKSVLWRWFAPGARLRDRVVLRLPALRRLEEGRIAVDARAPSAPEAPLAVSIDGDPPSRVVLDPERKAWLVLPARGADGADVTLSPTGTAVLDGIVVRTRPEVARAVVAGIAVALIAFLLLRARARDEAVWLALFTAGATTLGCLPGWTLLAWPGGATVARILLPATIATGGLAVALVRARERSSVARLALLIAAGLFGCWVRAYFLPSAGSWDVDYWRTAILNGSAHGFGQTYGGPDDVPEGHLLAQLTGKERVSTPSMVGRPIMVNYPPLTITMWTLAWRMAARWGVRLESIEAQALATKVSPVVGDFLAVAVLLWIHRARPWRAATLAALYWATPVSWLSGAVLGYQDGAYAPLAVIALAVAATGRGFWAGATLGVATMVKLQALLLTPAVAGALIAGAGAWPAIRRLAAAAAGGLIVIVLAFTPFVLAGTLPAAVVHVNNSWLPGPTSGGSPNIWWLIGHVMTTLRKGGSLLDRVQFIFDTTVGLPFYAVGRILWITAAVAAVLYQRRFPGLRPAMLAGATVFFSYAMLATGAYENHIHTLFLLLLAGGLTTRRCRVIAALAATVYVLDMLMMSGLGRFYTWRYLVVETLTPTFDAVRMGLGFDLTVLLAVVNLALFVAWWAGLPAALRAPDDGGGDAYRRPRAVA
jgi:hypothetical protein